MNSLQRKSRPQHREERFGQRGVTVLIYGLTGSGKASIAYEVEKRLWDAGRAVTVLYGPDMRQGLCRDLGFSADDRSENLRRSAEVAKILNTTEETARWRVFKARQKLMKVLSPDLLPPGAVPEEAKE